jgi:transcriptional regulator with XRE-family HTH domain
MNMTLLVQRLAPTIPFAAGQERYQRLADELGRYAGTTVRIVQEFSPEAVNNGYLLWVTSGDPARLLGGLRPAVASHLAARTVLVDVSWQQALEQLDRYRFAAAVDSLRLSEWLARPSSALGPFGLSRLASVIGASCVSLPALRARHYCLLEGGRHQGMPHVLADYLRAYDQDLKPLSSFSSVMLSRALPPASRSSDASEGPPRAGFLPMPSVECVSTGRAVASLKRAREQAQVTVAQLADLTGIEPLLLSRLETGDVHNATLGTLREYAVAMKDVWGWYLAGVGGVAQRRPAVTHVARQGDLGVPVPGMSGEEMAAGRFSTPVIVERGYTVRAANLHVPRSSQERELEKLECH